MQLESHSRWRSDQRREPLWDRSLAFPLPLLLHRDAGRGRKIVHCVHTVEELGRRLTAGHRIQHFTDESRRKAWRKFLGEFAFHSVAISRVEDSTGVQT